MNFYKTNAGQKFFNAQLPRLIRALEDISSSMKQKQQAVKLPTEVPDNYLEELYYGNLNIGVNSEEGYKNQYMKEILLLQEELMSQLTPEQRDIFLKYNRVTNSRNLDETCRQFQHGYCLAVQLITAGLQQPK